MKAILALDEGTTGSTALVVAQDGRVLGRGYREIPQHFPQPGWVEHDPNDLFDKRIPLQSVLDQVFDGNDTEIKFFSHFQPVFVQVNHIDLCRGIKLRGQ